jgi:hypothetical protein
VFNEEYNFSFHVPKKNQCGLCISYHQAKDEGNLTPVLKEEYENHQERKVKAREEKKRDKELEIVFFVEHFSIYRLTHNILFWDFSFALFQIKLIHPCYVQICTQLLSVGFLTSPLSCLQKIFFGNIRSKRIICP